MSALVWSMWSMWSMFSLYFSQQRAKKNISLYIRFKLRKNIDYIGRFQAVLKKIWCSVPVIVWSMFSANIGRLMGFFMEYVIKDKKTYTFINNNYLKLKEAGE